jgi:hypothetical protein
MSSEGLLATAISIATVVISATQIIIAHLSRSKELEIARIDQERKWKLSASEFLINHVEDIFSKDSETRMRTQDILKIAFPPEIVQGLVREFDHLVLAELLAPLVIQLGRTKEAFNRWDSKNLLLEADIVRDANQAIRDLLIHKAHLIPSDLMEDAQRLIAHYDRWLEEFDRVRKDKKLSDKTEFVFAGPQGFPFPADAERKFIERYNQLKPA